MLKKKNLLNFIQLVIFGVIFTLCTRTIQYEKTFLHTSSRSSDPTPRD